MRPFRLQYYFPNVGAGEVVPLSVPNSNFFLQHLTVAGGGAFNATLYSREFTNTSRRVAASLGTANGSGTTTIDLWHQHNFRVGDHLLIKNGGTPVATLPIINTLSERRLVLQGAETIVADDTVTLVMQAEGLVEEPRFGATSRVAIKPAKNVLDLLTRSVLPGDIITISGASFVGYNTAHRVLAVLEQENKIVLDVAYNADESGILTLEQSVDSNDKPAFEIIPLTAASSNAVKFSDSYGKPISISGGMRRQASANSFLYLLISAAGDYSVSLGGSSPH